MCVAAVPCFTNTACVFVVVLISLTKCVCVYVRARAHAGACASVKLPDTCRHLPSMPSIPKTAGGGDGVPEPRGRPQADVCARAAPSPCPPSVQVFLEQHHRVLPTSSKDHQLLKTVKKEAIKALEDEGTEGARPTQQNFWIPQHTPSYKATRLEVCGGWPGRSRMEPRGHTNEAAPKFAFSDCPGHRVRGTAGPPRGPGSFGIPSAIRFPQFLVALTMQPLARHHAPSCPLVGARG